MQNELIDGCPEKKEKLLFPYFLLGLFSVFAFLANHNALFISDYSYFLIAIILFGCGEILARGTIRITKESGGALLLLFMCLFSSAINRSLVDSGTLLSYGVWFLMYSIITTTRTNKRSIDFALKGYIFGATILAVLILILQIEYGQTGRFTIQIGKNEAIDPNYLAAFLYNGLFFCIIYLVRGKKTLLLFGEVALILFGIVLTGSRAVYLSVGVLCIGLLLNGNLSKRISAFLVVIVGIIVFYTVIYQHLPDAIQERLEMFSLFNDKNIFFDDSNRVRYEHWANACRTWFHKPLFGFGAAHTKALLTNFTGHAADAHNTFLTFLLHFGLIGFSIIAYILKKAFFPKNRKKSTLLIFYFITFVIYNNVIANHLGISFWLPIILIGRMNDYFEEYFV